MSTAEDAQTGEDHVAATDVASTAPETRAESTANRKIVLFTATLAAAAITAAGPTGTSMDRRR